MSRGWSTCLLKSFGFVPGIVLLTVSLLGQQQTLPDLGTEGGPVAPWFPLSSHPATRSTRTTIARASNVRPKTCMKFLLFESN